MVYQFQLLPHANTHYRESLKQLGANELSLMLSTIGIFSPIHLEEIGGCAFFRFEARELSNEELAYLRRHSALLLMCQDCDGLLRPLGGQSVGYLPDDLAEVLKYKGKTSATFTQMMINCAMSVSDFSQEAQPLVLDPMCGKGTTLFCAAQHGMNAIGIDVDANDLAEADRYLTRYLQLHKLKHQRAEQSITVQGKGIPQIRYTLADTAEHYRAKDVRSLTMIRSDAALSAKILKRTPAHVLVTDLPYGVQHAPVAGKKPESFPQLLRRIMPAWFDALRPGGAVAISFNRLTLPRQVVAEIAQEAGFVPVAEAMDFSHFVEQAITRDVLLAKKEATA